MVSVARPAPGHSCDSGDPAGRPYDFVESAGVGDDPRTNVRTVGRTGHTRYGPIGIRRVMGQNIATGSVSCTDCRNRTSPPPPTMLSMSIEELEAAAMQLSPTERERLGEKLLSSVDTPLQHEEEWADAADRRIAEMLNGAVERVSGDEVFRAAVNRLK